MVNILSLFLSLFPLTAKQEQSNKVSMSENSSSAPADNQLGELKLYKLRPGYSVALPKDACLALGMRPGTTFLAIRAIGPCLVISRATDVSSDESRLEEADGAIERMIGEWLESKGQKLYRIAPCGDAVKK